MLLRALSPARRVLLTRKMNLTLFNSKEGQETCQRKWRHCRGGDEADSWKVLVSTRRMTPLSSTHMYLIQANQLLLQKKLGQ